MAMAGRYWCGYAWPSGFGWGGDPGGMVGSGAAAAGGEAPGVVAAGGEAPGVVAAGMVAVGMAAAGMALEDAGTVAVVGGAKA
jgi:hypothetical protein